MRYLRRNTIDWHRVWKDVTSRVGQTGWEFSFTEADKQDVKGSDANEEAPSGLLTERSSTYGQSWLLSGAITAAMVEFGVDFNRLKASDYDWPWEAILNKLTRLTQTPDHLDSWKDIEGYARLVREHLETGETYGNK